MVMGCQICPKKDEDKVSTCLYDDFHQILLRNHLFAPYYLLQYARQNDLTVHGQVNPFKLAQPDKVGSNQDTQFLAFHLSLFAFFGVALMLETNPKFVHFDKVGENKSDRVL